MPYVQRQALGNLIEIGGTIQPLDDLTTVASDVQFGTITLPNIIGGILSKVYVDIQFRFIRETSGLLNYLDVNSDIIASKGGNTSVAGTLNSGSLYCYNALTASELPGMRYYGYADVKARFALGETTTIYLNDATALHDAIVLRDLQAIARCIIK